jgi:hypothetical protein
MQQSAKEKKFKSTLYHTYDAYTDVPDAVMVSHKVYWFIALLHDSTYLSIFYETIF